ncbi:biotin/lipoyl-containing protein [Rhodovulum sp.]|uniref:biotin/lipoyl-containing protein n=1 Tax=Rhodovulum sp. TaxID=34009 RepID=UPI00257FCAB5|nr:biotin/lipoyl-containing protein [Rhodovulum sp.]
MGLFTMPSLGADMEAGTLTEWRVGPGDRVRRGDIVAVVETRKGAIEIEILEEGTVERLEAEIGQTLPVGAPLARIRGPGKGANRGRRRELRSSRRKRLRPKRLSRSRNVRLPGALPRRLQRGCWRQNAGSRWRR